MRIGCDMDGVICDAFSEIRSRIKKDFDIDVPDNAELEDFTDYPEIPSNWLYRVLFSDEWFWAKCVPHEKNIDKLNQWADVGHEIHIVTGRPKEKSALVTLNWLKRNGVKFTKLTFEPVMHKVVYLKENGIPVIFEDRFFEANRCASFGIRSFVIRQKWNIDYEHRVTNPLLTFIDDLSGADDYVNGVEPAIEL